MQVANVCRCTSIKHLYYVYSSMYVFYVCMFVCLYVCMYVCIIHKLLIYIYIYIHRNSNPLLPITVAASYFH